MADSFFDISKISAIEFLEGMVRFTRNLEQVYPKANFTSHTKALIGLTNKIKGSARPSLNEDDIAKVDNFRKYLCIHSTFASKLKPCASLCLEIGTATFEGSQVSLQNIHGQNLTNHFWLIDSTIEAILAIREQPNSILSMLSILALLVGRKETFYHSLKRFLKDAAKDLNLNEYDIAEMCSVHSKVARKNSKISYFESDVEVLRNCIAHTSYKIKKQSGDYLVHFETHDNDYDFVKEFTSCELVAFFEDFILLEILENALLVSGMYQAMMKMALCRTETTSFASS